MTRKLLVMATGVGVCVLLAAAALATGYPVVALLIGFAALVPAFYFVALGLVGWSNRDGRLGCSSTGWRWHAADDCTSPATTPRRCCKASPATTATGATPVPATATTCATSPGRNFTSAVATRSPAEWGPTIQQAVTEAQFPAAWNALMAGQRLDFGPLWVRSDSVGSAKKSWPWSQVQEIRVKDGIVRLRSENRWLALTSTAVRQIPNYFMFITLADRMTSAHRTDN